MTNLHMSKPAIISRRTASAALVAAASVIGLMVWSFSAELSGAVIAPARIVVDGNIKRVQAATSGTVTALMVRDGAFVAAGDVLLRIDETQHRASRDMLVGQIVQLEARRSRLAAERDAAADINWVSNSTAPGAAVAQARQEEMLHFQRRRELEQGQALRLNTRIEQTQRERSALRAQAAAKSRELELVQRERGLVATLERQRLTNFTRPISIDRDIARFEGDLGAIEAQAARADAAIAEIELQKLMLIQTRVVEAQRDLRDIDGRLDELRQRLLAAEEQLARVEIRAPVDGTVHELAVHGTGAYIRPGETILALVPERTGLVAEIRVRPQDIDQVRPNQRVRVRIAAFNRRTTPELYGNVERVGADLIQETRTTPAHYTAHVLIKQSELDRLGPLKLLPGMPAEAFMITEARTFASYLGRPFADHMRRAFREE